MLKDLLHKVSTTEAYSKKNSQALKWAPPPILLGSASKKTRKTDCSDSEEEDGEDLEEDLEAEATVGSPGSTDQSPPDEDDAWLATWDDEDNMSQKGPAISTQLAPLATRCSNKPPSIVNIKEL